MYKRLPLIACLLLFMQLISKANNSDSFPIQSDTARVKLDSMWVDYDIKQDGVLGMMVHFKFTAYNMKDKDAYLAIYFEYDDEYGGVLKDRNNKYVSSSGDVAVYRSIKPGYTTAVYNDFQVFVPYEELDLSPGYYDLGMDAKIIHKEGGLLAPLKWYPFTYREPAKN